MSISQSDEKKRQAVEHKRRLIEWNQRKKNATEQCQLLAKHQLQIMDIEKKTRAAHEFSRYDPVLEVVEKTTQVVPGSITQGNTTYCKLLKYDFKYKKQNTSMYCRYYSLSALTGRIDQIAIFQDYFSRLSGDRFFKIKQIFFKESEWVAYLFHEQFPSSSLAHRLWNNDVSKRRAITWTQQLASAVETLNLAGVCHRFIRLENVLLDDSEKIKLTCFDMACTFRELKKVEKSRWQKGLPTEVPRPLWDHLPEECFAQAPYNAELVDTWSVGVVFCTLLTDCHPFDVNEPATLVQQWISSPVRASITERLRSLLDDIFQPSHQRMTSYDLAKDIRFNKKALKEEATKKYYRIDMHPNNPPTVEEDEMVHFSLDESKFSPNCLPMFKSEPDDYVTSEETLHDKNFVVLRNSSFGADTIAFRHEQFLKAKIKGRDNYLVKIIMLHRLPKRHYSLLAFEGWRIMRYLGTNDVITSLLHVEAIFCIGQRGGFHKQMYFFFKNELSDSKSLRQLAVERAFVSHHENLRKLMAQLADTVAQLTNLGVSHRYLRPEHIYVTTKNTIKVTYLDMACFMWNPVKKMVPVRSSGLQDLQEHCWDHLPPECFNNSYKCCALDVWSFGVILVFCLTRLNPFKVPHSSEVVSKAWTDFKSHSNISKQLGPHRKLLDRVFLPAEKRITSAELQKVFSGLQVDSSSSFSSSSL